MNFCKCQLLSDSSTESGTWGPGAHPAPWCVPVVFQGTFFRPGLGPGPAEGSLSPSLRKTMMQCCLWREQGRTESTSWPTAWVQSPARPLIGRLGQDSGFPDLGVMRRMSIKESKTFGCSRHSLWSVIVRSGAPTVAADGWDRAGQCFPSASTVVVCGHQGTWHLKNSCCWTPLYFLQALSGRFPSHLIHMKLLTID